MGLTKRRILTLGASMGTTTLLVGCTSEEGVADSDVGPSFELISSNAQQDFITPDDTLRAGATVENVGDNAGKTTVTFDFDGSRETGETSELEPGESEQVIVDIGPPIVDPGRYTLAIELAGEQVATNPIILFDTIDEPGIYGAVFSESDLNLSDARVRLGYVYDSERNEGEFPINENNQFRISGGDFTDLSVDITLKSNTPGEFDGIPTILALTDDHVVSNDIEFLGPYEIPEAYRTEIQLVNEDGNPIPDFTLFLRSSTGVARRYTTNENGYVIARDASNTGVSLPSENESDILIDAYPKNSNRPERIGEVYGSKQGEEFVFELSEPNRFS